MGVYNELSDAFGEPQIYKGVKFYPIKLADEATLNLIYEVLSYNKNKIADVDIIRASYLKFVVYYMTNPTEEDFRNSLLYKTQELLSILTKQDVYIEVKSLVDSPSKDSDFIINVHIGDTIINETEFEKVREIILLQANTSVEYIESYDEDLEQKVGAIKSDSKPPTLAERIFILSVGLKMPIEQIKNLTYYQFCKYMERLDLKIEHDLYKPLLVSGQISFKGNTNIKSWNEHIGRKTRYSEILVDMDKFEKESTLFQAFNQGGN